VRDDSGVYAGAEISIYYDPMISKLIAWGPDRASAIERMGRALAEYQVRGIKTNLAFHRRVMVHPGFRSGDYDTGFIEQNKAVLCAKIEPEGEALDDAIATAAIEASLAKPPDPPEGSAGVSAWRRGDGWLR
jgi:acetyl-CoA carboxylase biotin carboxylase subunit